MKQNEDFSEIEAALGLLINLSGKMRMLSHRIAMTGLLMAADGSERDRALELFDAALAEFTEIAGALQQGSVRHGVSPEIVTLLAAAEAVKPEARSAVEHFVGEAQRLRPSLEAGTAHSGRLRDLVYFVATDLLRALNSVTEGVNRTLQAQFALRNERAAHVRTTMLDAVRSINDVSIKVKLISLNASVEAARAGDKGRSFGVIASEIRVLSEDAARSAQGIMEQIKLMA